MLATWGAAQPSILSLAQGVSRNSGGTLLYVADDFIRFGDNVVVNGDFAVDANWTKPAGFSITGGKLVASGVATGAGSNQTIAFTAGVTYEVTYTISDYVSGALQAFLFGGTSVPGSIRTANGTYTEYLTSAAGGNTTLRLYAQTALTANIDNVIVRPIVSASVYQDTAGTLPAYLTSVTGLLTDRSFNGAVGSELVTNGDFATDTSDWAKDTEVTISGGNLVFTTTTAARLAQQTISFTPNKSYRVTYTVNSVSGSGVRVILDATGTYQVVGATRTAPGTYSEILVPSSLGSGYTNKLRFQAVAAGVSATIDNVSVRELLGNHATQSTTANKPTLTRVPKRLGSELVVNGTFDVDAAGWTTYTASSAASSGSLTVTSSGSYGGVYQNVSVASGKSYLVTANASIGTTNSTSLKAGGSSLQSTTSATQTKLYGIATASSATLAINLENGSTVGSSFWDNISVKEVLEWAYAESFDGTNDFLQLATNPIGATLTQPYTIVVSGVVGALGAALRMYGDDARFVGISSAGKVNTGHGGIGGVDGPSTLSQGQSVVISVTWDGSAFKVYLNGATEINTTLATPTTAASAAMIGRRGGVGTEYFNGTLSFCEVCNSVLSDSDRKILEKAAALQAGVTL